MSYEMMLKDLSNVSGLINILKSPITILYDFEQHSGEVALLESS